MKVNRERFFNEKEKNYRNEVLRILNSICDKGIIIGLNDEEEALRKEINMICDDYYFNS